MQIVIANKHFQMQTRKKLDILKFVRVRDEMLFNISFEKQDRNKQKKMLLKQK